MKKYDPKEFIKALSTVTKGNKIRCPFCGGESFTSTDSFATILIAKDIQGLSIGPSIPAGMLICTKCGHINYFALGALGLLKTEDGVDNGKAKN